MLGSSSPTSLVTCIRPKATLDALGLPCDSCAMIARICSTGTLNFFARFFDLRIVLCLMFAMTSLGLEALVLSFAFLRLGCSA